MGTALAPYRAGGADLVAVRDLMGHTDIRTTNIYAHSEDAKRQDAVDLRA